MKRNFSYLLVLFLLSAVIANAQSGDGQKSILESGAYQVKMNSARQKFYSDSYNEALTIYKDLYASNGNDAVLNFRMGECYLALAEYSKALEHLEKARTISLEVDKEFNYITGQVYHKLGKLDQALVAFNQYKAATKDTKEEYKEADRFIAQCLLAKKMTNKPVKNQITVLSSKVNSIYDDYSCSITTDGKTMVFTSRRPETIGGGIDKNDGKYFEDIYISKWDEERNYWGDSKQLPGKLNTSFHDAVLSLSPDGSQIFTYKNIPGETKSGDIFVSKKNATGVWAQSRSISEAINSSYFESSASITADGNYLYFVSERKGGLGKGDIYRSRKISANEWAEPENLGAIINTAQDEISVFITADGKTLYFSSNSARSMGGLDIFKSVNENGLWSEPQNLGFPINTFGDDLHFNISVDKTAYYSSVKPDGIGGRDIYMVDFKAGIIEGPEINPNLDLSQNAISSAPKNEVVNSNFNALLIAKIDSLQMELKAMKTELTEVKTLLNKQAAPKESISRISERNAVPSEAPVQPVKIAEVKTSLAVKEESPVAKKQENFKKPEKGYYIVLASSKEKEIAENNAKNYSDSGLEVFIFQIEDDSWYYVALEKNYTSIKEAKGVAIDYRKKKYNGTWYFYVD